MELHADVIHFDFALDVSKEDVNKKELMKVLNHLKPTWDETNLICTDLSGGYLNLILRCHMKSSPDDSVVFRIWPQNSTVLIETFKKRETERSLLHKLGEKGVAPELFASFTNGVCYEYFDGEKLTPEICKTDEVAKSIARNFAKIHGVRIEGFCPEQQIFKLLESVYKSLPNQMPEPDKTKNQQARHFSKEDIADEMKVLEEYLKGLNSPIVQCHGDAHPQNMMYNKETGKVILLDYELAHTGYQAADLAYYFVTLTLGQSFKIELLPSESYQRNFLRWYLEEWFETTGRKADDVTADDVNILFIQVQKYLLFTFFYFAMVFFKFNAVENKDEMHEVLRQVDWSKVGMEFFGIYFENKEHYMSLKIPE